MLMPPRRVAYFENNKNGRKKKCIRYMEAISSGSAGSSGTKDDCYQELDDLDDHGSDDNLGSPQSIDDNNKTPDNDIESLNHSLSSPGCLSGLSSLQSPSTSLASPLNLLASPATPVTVGLTFGIGEHQQNAQTQQPLPHQQSALQAQQLLLQPSSVVDASATQQMRMQQSGQQIHLGHSHTHTAPPLSRSSIFENPKATRSFLCTSSGSGGASVLVSPTLSNNCTSGICIANSLTNTSSSTAAAVAAAAFTERTMLTILSPSPSTLLINSNCFPPSNLESSNGAIGSIAQMLSNTNNATSSLNANISKSTSVTAISSETTITPTTTGGTGRSNECNSYISSTNCGIFENISAVTVTQSTFTATKPIAVISGKSTASSSASSAASSPAAENFEKSNVVTTHRNPIGANPHDINNPLSINQLTKCDEGTSSSNCHNKSQNIGAEVSTTSASTKVSNGVAQQYKDNSQLLQKELVLRLPPAAAQHQQLTTSALLTPAQQQYQQQFHFHGASGPPPLPSHHNAHHHHPHAHSPLFNQHFQQFSHHLASVAAVAAAAAGVHVPNILNATVVSANNSIHRSPSSVLNNFNMPSAFSINEAPSNFASPAITTTGTGTSTEAVTSKAAETSTAAEGIRGCNTGTVSNDISMPISRHLVAATATDASVNGSTSVVVNASAAGGENGAISVT
ncbi:mucin-5AC-like [Anastrepha ludens]|uniref:mucin-5AC-like n=1 Tax=Anastrepha ludens TaxID=28586 RepID=UPI0023B1188C|nr:mucin-5AC-like [Anastrepha ludens]